VGVKKSRAFNRALSIMLVSGITFIICCINPNAISMIYAISGPMASSVSKILPTPKTNIRITKPSPRPLHCHRRPPRVPRTPCK
ncbi:hypothetical protein ONJ16_27430, partial [Salmonella enterica subsp. enterica serovar Montevideo]|nr:hypothetical protein [Salmonella enterica subsp. enterica serovar Montevideo]